ncbi:MAG: SpvB/TcaC N-terminal domain-containing protein [Candidatus Omnitrophota bacterium]
MIIDSVAPTGSFTINSNAKYSNQLTVTLRLSLTDSSSGLDTMQFSNDGLTWTMAEPYATTKNWKLNSGDGQKIVYVKVSDKAGNASTAIAKSILLDMTPPNIVITSPIDRSFVNTPNKSVQYTCDGTAKSRVVMLTEGINTVTIQDNDAAGNVGSASIQVTLDTVPPEGSINVNNGALYTSQTQVTLALTAVDSSAGMDKMRFSTNNVSWSAPESYASTKTYTLPIGDGVKNIYVKYSDKAGNWSAVYSASITLFTGILIDQVKGGEVVSPDGKAKLIIPPGALWTTTRICIMTADPSLLQGSAPQHYLLQTLVDCKPSGLIFRKPCELDVELGQAEVPGTPIELGLLDETTQKIVFMEESTSVGSDGTSMKFPITHFSTYAGLASSLSQGAPIGAGVQVPLPDMLTGAFGHSLSLSVPPGRKGLQPSVNLQYKSSNTNSFVGVGWSLTPGYITRSTKLGPASYDDIKDTFVFVTDSGAAELTHLIDSLYQAKIESSFARFYKEEDSWRVVQKDGAVLRFGDTVDSKEISDRGTFLWNLTKVSDTNSNYMELTYGKDGGKSYLDRIDYTGNDATGTEPLNSIEFILEGRTDVSSNFSNGSEISIAKRLAEIRVKCQDRLVWRYLLTYEYSPGSSRSLLKTVTQFSSNRKAFPPQTFSYQKPHD